ncbi:MAG: SCO family protein [Gammaproteobacteria bacterium]|nr:SCO family protein [Gammaproteobacteria bacterium]
MKPNIRYLMLGLALLIAVSLLLWNASRPQDMTTDELASLGVVVLPEPVPMTELALVDEDGGIFDRDDLQGKWTFGFFGYTHCPDICPVTLAQMDTVFERLETQGDTETLANVQRLFVSIDVKRDDHNAVKKYTDNIDPDIIGVAGDPSAIKHFADSVYVGYKQLGDPNATENYLVEHQGNIVIFDRNGDCYGFIKSPFEEHLLARIFVGLARLS